MPHLRLQTDSVLLRPWCILEVIAAFNASVPIVALVLRGKGYDFADSQKLLTFLDTELDRRNPGACDLLRAHDVDPTDAAFILSQLIPNIISIELDSSGSENMLEATIKDIAAQMKVARPVALGQAKDAWLAERGSPSPGQLAPGHQHARDAKTDAAAMAPLPVQLPELPKGNVLRQSILEQAKQALGKVDRGKVEKLVLVGMGGSGKTCAVVSIARDPDVRVAFKQIAYVAIGQVRAQLACIVAVVRGRGAAPLRPDTIRPPAHLPVRAGWHRRAGLALALWLKPAPPPRACRHPISRTCLAACTSSSPARRWTPPRWAPTPPRSWPRLCRRQRLGDRYCSCWTTAGRSSPSRAWGSAWTRRPVRTSSSRRESRA